MFHTHSHAPVEMNVELSESIAPLAIIMEEFAANGIGVFWKHSSVSSEPRGHSLLTVQHGGAMVE